MKKIKFISFIFLMIMSLGILCSCGGEAGPQGPQGEQGIQGEVGPEGEPGKDGQDGHSPEITIGENGNWYIDGVDTGVSAEGTKGETGEPGKDGQDGVDGEDGKDGISVVSITLTSTNGNLDTYTILFSDNTTTTFTVTNGKDGVDGAQGTQGEPGKDGASISKVEFNEQGQLVITLSDGTVLDPVDLPKQDEHIHSFTEWYFIKEPTCEERGIDLRLCEECNYTESRYIDLIEHTYVDGYCSRCNLLHPNLKKLEGKVISILGDSISTFAGYIPTADGFNLEHIARYPQDNLLTDVNETWWMQVLTELNAKLGVNESWRSTEIGNIYDVEVNSGYEGTKACMASLTRIQNLGSNGTPDIILFYGGTNDITQRRIVGEFNAETAPSHVDLTSVKWDTVAEAYVATIMRMQHFFPDAQIIAMLPTYTSNNTNSVIEKYNTVFANICKHYKIPYIDLRNCGITTSHLPDGTHPNAEGMDYITDAVLNTLLNECVIKPGENIVHKVVQKLSNAKSSLSYYKSVSSGKSFTTVILGEELSVVVKMGDEDITSFVYKNGTITIPCVTDDILIIAEGKVKKIYDDYLQLLPENICSKTNLWNILEPQNIYYTSSGWGNLANGKVYSITIPVLCDEKIWASSFQIYGSNGNTSSSTSGIRVTWFYENGAIKSLSPNETYEEVLLNGYLTVPEGVIAANIPVWNNEIDNEVYILSKEHIYEGNVCIACGELCIDFSTLTFTAFGDSITYGADLIIGGRVANPYPTVLREILGFKSYENKGISGATLTTNDQGLTCMTDVITSYTSQADIIGVLGGVNDYNRNLPLGDLDDNDTSTIYGALHVSMSYLSENYSDSFIFYMTPYKEYFHGVLWSDINSQGYNLEDVANAIKEVAEIYDIPVLDLLEEGNFESIMYNDDCDGIHPNQEFITNVMAPQIAEFIQENYE